MHSDEGASIPPLT